MEPRGRRSLLIALAGVVLGFAAGGVIGGFVGAAMAPDNAGLEALAYPLVGIPIGGWVAAMLGCWFAIKITGEDPRWFATFWFIALSGPVIGGAAFLAGSLTDADSGVPWPGQYAIVLSGIVATIYLARKSAGITGRR